MSVTGDVNTLALADLLQVSALSRRTCRIRVQSQHAEGHLFVQAGEVVHAAFGDLVGAEALYALLNTPDLNFEVEPNVRTDKRTIDNSWQHLVLEAARLGDEHQVPQPHRFRTYEDLDTARGPENAPLTPPPIKLDTLRGRRGGMMRSAAWITALLMLAGGLGVAALRHPTRPSTVAQAAAIDLAHDSVVEATYLTGPGDELPMLAEGAAPESPSSALAITPTIVCRLVISADGRVRESHIYRSRLELVSFEDAALAAVQKWRFHPAKHAGRAVAVAINWPVTFVRGTERGAHSISIKGSDTIGGALAPAFARAYMAKHPGVRISVQALGSKTAFTGLFDRSADLGASSRPVNTDELRMASSMGVSLREFVFAYDGVAVIVNPRNPVKALGLEQVAAIFSGKARSWSDVGGANAPIRVISRPTYSGTHSFFKEKVLRRGDPKSGEEFAKTAQLIEDNRDIVRAIASDPNAIAYVGSGWLTDEVHALGISVGDGAPVVPATTTVRNGSYPVYRPLLFYTVGAPRGDVADFLRFVLSAEGQRLVTENGFVPSDVPADALLAAQGAEEPAAALELEPVRLMFGAGSTKLPHDARARLTELKQRLGDTPHRLLLVGHSDAEGTRNTNEKLSLWRAQRVADYLVSLGVDNDSLQVEGDSADAPLATNSTLAGRSQNRRVDIFVLPK
jgi:phosphate binding protein